MTSANAGESARDPESGRRAPLDPRITGALTVAAGLLFAFSHRSFLFPYRSHGLEQGVEYWFFRPNESGALVVLALSAWLLYRRWRRLRALPAQSGPSWLIGAACSAALLCLGWAVHASAPHLMAFSLAFAACAVALLYRGFAGLRVCWLPILFVVFAIPIPAPLMLWVVWKLQIFTAEYAGWLLFLLREPALVSGDQIIRASQTFQVIETCSGLRSIETLSMLTVTLIDLFRRRGLHALLLLLAAPAIAFALNGVRVLTLILNPHSEVMAVHTLQGLTTLLGGVLILYWLDGLIERVVPKAPARSRVERASRKRAGDGDPARASRRRVGTVLAGSLVAVVASEAMPISPEAVRTPGTLEARIDEAAQKWPSEDVVKDWTLESSVRFGDSAHREYLIQGAAVEVFVGTASRARNGGSPLSPATAFPGAGWHIVGSERTVLPGDQPIDARVLKKGSEQLLVYHWYAGSAGLLHETLRALLSLDQTRFKRQEPLYVVRLGTPLEIRSGETPEKSRELAEFRLRRAYTRLAPVLAGLAP